MSPYTGDFWKRGETLGEHLERRGIDRREFLAWCARMAVLMGLGPMVTEGAESSTGNALAARPNPTGATGVQDILTDRPVINVPGCPPIGEVITGCITYLLTQGHAPPCDMEGRPLFAYGSRIHDNCPRRAFYDAGQFVGQFDDAAARQRYCLYHMGCKGPATWNSGGRDAQGQMGPFEYSLAYSKSHPWWTPPSRWKSCARFTPSIPAKAAPCRFSTAPAHESRR